MLSLIKPFTLLLLLSCTLSVNAQFHEPRHKEPDPTDSIKYYSKIISDIYKNTLDSLRKSEAFKTALAGYKHHAKLSNGYTSFTIFGDIGQASYDAVNKGIAQSGFPPLNGPQYRVGIGISHEYHNRWLLEFYYATIGISNQSKKGNASVKSSYSNVLQFNLGYDFIKSQKINIYPYAGLALRGTNLTYKEPDLMNNNFTSIIDIVQKEGTTNANKLNLSYQAGLGFDFVVHESSKGHGTMLFLRGGTDGILGSRTFNIHGVKYDADIKQGAWIVAFGFKFFGRG